MDGTGTMDKVIIAPFGSHGDILPCLDIGRELVKRGRSVLAIANPYYSSLIEKSGIDFVPAGERNELLKVFHDAGPHDGNILLQTIRDCMHRFISQATDVISAHRSAGQTILLSTSIGTGLRSIAHRLGIPTAMIHFSPTALCGVSQIEQLAPPRLPGEKSKADGARSRIEAYAEAASSGKALQIGRSERNVSNSKKSDVIIGAFPDWYAGTTDSIPSNVVLTDFPLHDDFMDTTLGAEIEAFLSAGPPPVGFTPGTANASAQEFFARSVDACVRTGRRAILLSVHRHHVPTNLPDSVLHVEYAPFKSLLPRLSAIVHHGGIGTASQAMRAGVPQLVQPLVYDQFDTADRLAGLGVGLQIRSDAYTVDRIIPALHRLEHATAVQSACDTLAMRMTGAGVGQICDVMIARLNEKAP